MEQANTLPRTRTSAGPLSFVSKRAARVVAAALGLGVLVPFEVNAKPGAAPIELWEGCPSPPENSWRVSCLQWVLDKYAAHEMGGPPYDGCYGHITEAGVIDVQRFFHVPDEYGFVGPKTGQAFDVIMLFNSTDDDFNWWTLNCLPHIPTVD
jgi:hypothetical protein